MGKQLSAHAVIDELPLPLSGDTGALDALVIGMVLEEEFNLVLTDAELAPERLCDRDRVVALLADHGVIV